jgi:hypothetical protein
VSKDRLKVDPTLQAILRQLNNLSTNQEELRRGTSTSQDHLVPGQDIMSEGLKELKKDVTSNQE